MHASTYETFMATFSAQRVDEKATREGITVEIFFMADP